MSNANESAFPRECVNDCDHTHKSCKGLTKREWFAGMALQGYIIVDDDKSYEQLAGFAFNQADAMLKEADDAK